MKKRPIIFLLLMLILHCLTPAQIVSAQDAEDSPEVQRLKEEKARAEARQAIAEARKAELDARFPKPTSSPLEGKTTTDGEFIEGQIMAYISVSQAADTMAERFRKAVPNLRVLVVHNAKDVSLLLSYGAAISRIDALGRRYDALIDEEEKGIHAAGPRVVPAPAPKGRTGSSDRIFSPSLALGAATSTLGSFVDFLSFLRTDVALTGKLFDVTEDVLVSELFRALREKYGSNVRLYYPGVVPPNVNSFKDSVILNRIDLLYTKKDKAEDLARQITELIAEKQEQLKGLKQLTADAQTALEKTLTENNAKIKTLKTEIEALKKNVKKNAQAIAAKEGAISALEAANSKAEANTSQLIDDYDKKYIKLLENDISILTTAKRNLPGTNAQFELLLKDLIKVDEESGISLITNYLQTENLLRAMDEKDAHINDDEKGQQSYWLALGVVKAGGNLRVKRNLIVDVFRGGSRVSHSGGTVVKYNLFSRDGLSILSGTAGKYTGYLSSKEIEKRTR